MSVNSGKGWCNLLLHCTAIIPAPAPPHCPSPAPPDCPLLSLTLLSFEDAEGLFFSIASLLCLLPGNQTQMVVELLCDQIISEAGAGKDRNSALKLRM